MVRPGLDFFSLVFALFQAGVVPVLIDPGIGLPSLAQCCREAAPEVFIGIPRALSAQTDPWLGTPDCAQAHPGRARRAGAMTLDGLRVAGGKDLEQGRETATLRVPSADQTAAILFTSGSTGPPKGVVYTHAIFQAQVDMLRSLYAIERGEIDLCTFPLFALFAPALGLTAVVPEMDPTRPARVDPEKIFEAIEDFGVTNLFGSPALLRRLVQGAEASGKRLPTLKRVISAGAPVPAAIMERLSRLLEPRARFTRRTAQPNLFPLHRSAATRFCARLARQLTRAEVCASAVRYRGWWSGSSGSAKCQFPPGPTTCSSPTG